MQYIKVCTIRSPWFIDEFLGYAHTLFIIIFITGFCILTSTNTPKIQYPKEVRVMSYGRTRSINRQKPKTKIKMKDAKKYKAISCMTCGIGCRSSERIWSMNAVLYSHGETLSLDIETLPVLLVNYQWSREQMWNRVRVSIVSTRTFRRTQIAISA